MVTLLWLTLRHWSPCISDDINYTLCVLTIRFQVLVDGLVRSCMTNRAGVFLDSSISGQCQLALGSMANSLLADPERQSSGQTVLDLLHNNLNKLMNGKGQL